MILILLLAVAAPINPLQSAFLASHRDYSAQLVDKFAETTADPAVIGQPFKFLGPLHNGQALGGQPGPWYAYNDGKLQFVFTLSQKHVDPGFLGPKYIVGIIGGSRKSTRSYIGSNAYGATARIQVEKLEQNGLVFLDGPSGERSPFGVPGVPDLRPPPDSYSAEFIFPGPQARKIALDAGLLIEGTIALLPNAKLSMCKGIYGGPEIDHPLEVYGSECWVGARVSRIAFVRRSTGEVLKEWMVARSE